MIIEVDRILFSRKILYENLVRICSAVLELRPSTILVVYASY
jgi:hypothetical protein